VKGKAGGKGRGLKVFAFSDCSYQHNCHRLEHARNNFQYTQSERGRHDMEEQAECAWMGAGGSELSTAETCCIQTS